MTAAILTLVALVQNARGFAASKRKHTFPHRWQYYEAGPGGSILSVSNDLGVDSADLVRLNWADPHHESVNILDDVGHRWVRIPIGSAGGSRATGDVFRFRRAQSNSSKLHEGLVEMEWAGRNGNAGSSSGDHLSDYVRVSIPKTAGHYEHVPLPKTGRATKHGRHHDLDSYRTAIHPTRALKAAQEARERKLALLRKENDVLFVERKRLRAESNANLTKLEEKIVRLDALVAELRVPRASAHYPMLAVRCSACINTACGTRAHIIRALT